MKIDIEQKPPDDIYKDRPRYIAIFIGLLVLACIGILLGAYAIIFDTKYYDNFETTALVFFVGSAVFISYFGEKLQAYKKLFPPQRQELTELAGNYVEIRTYCDLVAQSGRQLIRAEFEACQAFAQEKEQKSA